MLGKPEKLVTVEIQTMKLVNATTNLARSDETNCPTHSRAFGIIFTAGSRDLGLGIMTVL